MSNSVFYTLLFMYLLFAVVFISYYLLGPGKKVNYQQHEGFILGTWQRKGVSTTNEPWYINYTFTNTGFEISAQPALHIKGSYRIVSEIENLMLVEFYNIHPSLNTNQYYRHPQHLQVSVDKHDDLLTIDNRTYKRLSKQT